MKKPTEAIERMRDARTNGAAWPEWRNDYAEIFAYLDSIPPDAVPVVWPSYWPKKAIEQAANALDSGEHPHDALRCLRALAAIAPRRETRKMNLWKRLSDGELALFHPELSPPESGWRKLTPEPVEIEE